MEITRRSIRASNLPELEFSEKNLLLCNPPMKCISKQQFNGIRSCIANSISFRRCLIYNNNIALSPNLLLKLFKDFHNNGRRICIRSGTLEYPSFILSGDLSSLNVEHPRFITSPILKTPTFLKPHLDVSHQQVAQFDEALRQLYGVAQVDSQPLVNAPDDLSLASKILRNLILSRPETKCTSQQVTTYLGRQTESSDQPDHPTQYSGIETEAL